MNTSTNEGRIALVTGANKGIGLETARQLARDHGFTVLIGARDEVRGEEAAQILRGEGLDAQFLHISPTNAASIADAVREVESKFGVLDVLVNNAGMLLPGDFAPPAQVPLEVLRDTFDLNVFGMHAVTQAFWPLLNRSTAARLVNMSSSLGSLTLHASGSQPIQPLAMDASKAAMNMMTIHYAQQWSGTPHKANAAHPGNVLTEGNTHGEISVQEGAQTGVTLATLNEDGPHGGFFHMGEVVPW